LFQGDIFDVVRDILAQIALEKGLVILPCKLDSRGRATHNKGDIVWIMTSNLVVDLNFGKEVVHLSEGHLTKSQEVIVKELNAAIDRLIYA
jgi:hypothetical protein